MVNKAIGLGALPIFENAPVTSLDSRISKKTLGNQVASVGGRLHRPVTPHYVDSLQDDRSLLRMRSLSSLDVIVGWTLYWKPFTAPPKAIELHHCNAES
jgi:hypothetical protein